MTDRVASDTYRNSSAVNSDLEALRKLVTRLKTPDSWLRLDGCGCWCLFGPAGHVFAHSDRDKWLGGYLVVSHPGNGHRWAAIRAKLGGTVRQSGEDEGVVLVAANGINPSAVRQAIGCRQ